MKQTRLILNGFCLINKVLHSWICLTNFFHMIKWLYQDVPEMFSTFSLNILLIVPEPEFPSTSMAHGIAYLNYSQTWAVFCSRILIINLLIVPDKIRMQEVNVYVFYPIEFSLINHISTSLYGVTWFILNIKGHFFPNVPGKILSYDHNIKMCLKCFQYL